MFYQVMTVTSNASFSGDSLQITHTLERLNLSRKINLAYSTKVLQIVTYYL